MTANQFAASGYFQSVAGQNGVSLVQSPSATTFLSGGGGSTNSTYNYGYQNVGELNNRGGYFLMQPIIVGASSSNGSNTLPDVAGIGCGGGKGTASQGGPGMVLIASW